MICLVDKLFHSRKFPFKLDNQHHHESSWEASLKAFRSCVSISKLDRESDSISLSWIENSFDYLFNLNKAFAKLVLEIDYPMSKWEVLSIEQYLNFSLRLLDLLNTVKYSLSHVGQARISISHALSLVESSVPSSIQQLSAIKFKKFEINLKIKDEDEEKNISGKDCVIYQALIQMKKNSDLVFGIIISSLSGDIKPYLELKKSEKYSEDFEALSDKITILQDFKEYNELKACFIGAMEKGEIGYIEVRKLETKLEEIQKHLDDIEKKADDLFSEILAGRNEVLDVFRH